MNSDLKLLWLWRVLYLKALLTILAWGLPALLGPLSFLAILKVPIPEMPICLRLFGGAFTAFGSPIGLHTKTLSGIQRS